MPLPQLISELKRRRVFRVLGLYAVAAWISVQVADTVLPRLGAPPWTVSLVIVLAGVGFIVALALAWAFDLTGDGIRRTSNNPAVRTPPAPRRAAWFAAGILVSLSLGWYLARPDRPGATSLDEKLIAVMPFRVGGADAGVAYLREGMLDLLANTVVANDGTHALDAATTLSYWRRAATDPLADLPLDSARTVARSLGAAHLVLGSVTGTAAQLTLTVELIDAESGKVRTRTRAAGSADSIPQLVDQLAAEILAATAGDVPERASLLAGVPLPALRAYLDGLQAFRAARFDDAAQHHAAALATDSSFVLAAIGLDMAARWGAAPRQDVWQRARALIIASRDRLSAVDRAYVDAVLGRRYPLRPDGSEQLAAAAEMHRLAPHRADARFLHADYLFHFGAAVGIPDAHEQSAQLLDRILADDPDFVSAAIHRLALAFQRHDSATVQRISGRLLARDSSGASAAEMRWYSAAMRSDTATLRELIEDHRDDSTPLFAFLYQSVHAGTVLPQADAAVDAYAQIVPGVTVPFAHALNRGRMSRARRVLDEARARPDSAAHRSADSHAVTDAVYSAYDSADAAAAAARLEQRVSRPLPSSQTIVARCALAHRYSAQQRHDQVAATIASARAVTSQDSLFDAARYGAVCADYFEARLAIAQQRADAKRTVQRIDSILATAPGVLTTRELHMLNLGVAWMYEELGDRPAGLRTVRRRNFYSGDLGAFYASSLLTEARLAAATGDRDGASAAFRQYLALMSDPEPAFADNVAYARRELQRLTGER